MEMSGKWNSDEICIDEKTNGMTKIASKKKKKEGKKSKKVEEPECTEINARVRSEYEKCFIRNDLCHIITRE
jgi:hypothetical protein